MSRRRQSEKRKISPDPIYGSVDIEKFTNRLMKGGKKSIALNITLEPKDKTLSDNDIDQISKKIISEVQKTTGATLRS